MKNVLRQAAMLLVITVAVVVTAPMLMGAGATVKQAPISLTGLTISGATVEVYLNRGIMSQTNIRVGVVGPGQGHIQVHVPKLQGMSVGSLTNFSEANWVNVTTGDFFVFEWVQSFMLRTTNAINNVVSIEPGA